MIKYSGASFWALQSRSSGIQASRPCLLREKQHGGLHVSKEAETEIPVSIIKFLIILIYIYSFENVYLKNSGKRNLSGMLFYD